MSVSLSLCLVFVNTYPPTYTPYLSTQEGLLGMLPKKRGGKRDNDEEEDEKIDAELVHANIAGFLHVTQVDLVGR